MPSPYKIGLSSPRGRPDKRVLILDDRSSQLDALRGYFGRFVHTQRYQVHTASNGGEAAAALRQGRPDLIVLDPQMKGLNGLAFLKQVHDLDGSIPVIVVTGRQASGAAVEVLNAGVFAYVPKPCEFQELEHLVALVFAAPSRTAP